MRTLTKTGIRVLTKRYISVLKKCAILNAQVLMLGAIGCLTTTPANALELWEAIANPSTSSYTIPSNPYKVTQDLGELNGRNFAIYGNGKTIDGGGHVGIENSMGGTLELKNVSMQNFTERAIWNRGSHLSINGGDFTSNSSTYGSAIYNGGIITEIISNFSGNRASNQGGAIYNGWQEEINKITGDFINNSAQMGGAIYNEGSVAIIAENGKNIIFEGNTASKKENGGAIYSHERGAVHLLAAQGHSIEFKTDSDSIFNSSTELHIGQGGGNYHSASNYYTGKVILRDVYGSGWILVDSGALELRGNVNQGKIWLFDSSTSLIISEDGILNAPVTNQVGTVYILDGLIRSSIEGGGYAEKVYVNENKSANIDGNIYLSNLTMQNNSLLNLSNGKNETLTVGYGLNTNGTVYLSFDIIGDGNDTIYIKNNEPGTLILKNMNIDVEGDELTKTITLLTKEKDYKIHDYLGRSKTENDYYYRLVQDTGNTSNLILTKTKSPWTFRQVINADTKLMDPGDEPYANVTKYFVNGEMKLNEDIGRLQRYADTSGRTLTFQGTNKATDIINGQNMYAGITLLTGDTFALNNVSMKNFNCGDSGMGAAIYNIGGTISDATADFISNTTFIGGVIYNEGKIDSITGDFIDNSSVNPGGAIFNNKTGIVNIKTSDAKPNIIFSGNHVKSGTYYKGGAIYNEKEGVVGLYASDGHSITFVGGINDKTNEKYDIDGINNYGILNINGNGNAEHKTTGTVNLYNVNGTGRTNIYGGIANVADAAGFTQGNLTISKGATLESRADNLHISNTIQNAGNLNLTGGTLAQAITGAGTTNIKGTVISNVSIANAIGIDSGKSLTIGAGNIKADVTNAGTLNLGAGTLDQAIKGNGSITTTGNVISIASNLDNTVTNTGHTLTLTGNATTGALSKAISGTGTTVIDGSVIANAITQGTLNINTDKALAVSADNLNISNSLTNNGTLVTDGNLNNLTKLNNANGTVQIATNKTLDVTNDYTLGGTLDLNNATLNMQEQGKTPVAYSTLTVDTLKGTGNLLIDANVNETNKNADKIAYTNADNAIINLTNINVRDGFATHTRDAKDNYLSVLQGSGATFNVGVGGSTSTQYGDYLYTFEKGTAEGTLKVTEEYTGPIYLKDFITAKNKGDLVNTYSFADNETLSEAITTSEAKDTYAIGMNGKNLTGNGNGGITVANGNTLTVDGNCGTISDFSTALTNNGTLTLNNVNFSRNTTDVSNTGILNLLGENTFGSKITGTTGTVTNEGTLHIGATNLDVALTNNGTLVTDGNLNNLTKLNNANGTVQIATNKTLDVTNDYTLGGTLDLNNATLNMQEQGETPVAYSTLTVDTLKGTGNLLIDANVNETNKNADKIVYTNADNAIINLTNINVRDGFATHTRDAKDNYLSVLQGSGATFKVGDDSGKTSTKFGYYLYTFEKGTTEGTLKVTEELASPISLKDFITANDKGVLIDTYSFADNEALSEAITTGAAKDTYAIGMNGKNLTGNGNGGITVANGNTLTVDGNCGTISDFSTALTNNGTLTLNNVNFSRNTTDVSNTGILNLLGENTFGSKITGTTGTVTNEGTLHIGATNLDVALTNNGTLVTDGNLNHLSTLTNNGTVQIATNKTLDVTNDYTLGGTLDLNNATLNMQEQGDGVTSVYSTLTVNTLKGTGNLWIDVNVNETNKNADKIVYTNADNAVINLTNVNVRDGFGTRYTDTKDNYLTVLESNGATFKVGDDSGKTSTQFGYLLYTFEKGTAEGTLKVTEKLNVDVSLKDFITANDKGVLIDTYSFADNEALSEAITTGATKDTYAIGMNGKNLTGNGNGGITVANGNTLTVDGNGGTISDFSTALTNNGTLTLNNVNFSGNTTNVSNTGILNPRGIISDIMHPSINPTINLPTINLPTIGATINGGAIYNTGTITNITGVDDGTGNIIAFNGNIVTTSDFADLMGGAIYNKGTIANITGNFTSNKAISTSIFNGKGGAIYSDGLIGTIIGKFSENKATADGGAIYNGYGTISNITGDFNNNSSSSGNGGAIYNKTIISNIIGDFNNNSSSSGNGGAIWNAGLINIKTSDAKPNILFSGNYVTTGTGGAIYNGYGTVGLYANDGHSITFVGGADTANKKDIDGIYNNGTLNINGSGKTTGRLIIDGDGNIISGDGNAEYKTTGTVNLYNVNGTGTTNIYGGIANVADAAGFTQGNLTISSGAKLESKADNLRISTSLTNNGTLATYGNLNNLNTLNNKNGTVQIAANKTLNVVNNYTLGGTLDLNGQTLNMQDQNTAFSTLTVDTLKGTSNLWIDAALGSTPQSDKIVYTNADNAVINITNINVKEGFTTGADGTLTVLENKGIGPDATLKVGQTQNASPVRLLASNNVNANGALKAGGNTGKTTTIAGGSLYTFEKGETDGKLNVTKQEITSSSVGGAMSNEIEVSGSSVYVDTYSLVADEAWPEEIISNCKRYTVFMNGYNLIGGGDNNGAIISYQEGRGDEVIMNGSGTISNFDTVFINHGVLTLNNVTFSGNTTDVSNMDTGILNLMGENTFGSKLTGTGKTTNTGTLNISADNLDLVLTNNGTLNLGAGTLGKAVIGSGSITTKGDVKSNASNLGNDVINTNNTLTLIAGELDKTISGGNVTIAGDVISNAFIASAIGINEDKTLTIGADNIGGAVANSGTLNLTGGILAQAVSGGNVTIDGDVISNAFIASAIGINEDKTLTIGADNIGGAVANSGTLELIGGILTNNVSGEGIINFNGDVALDTSIMGGGKINFLNGTSLTSTLDKRFISGSEVNFDGNNTINMIVENTADAGEHDFINAGAVNGIDNVEVKNDLYNMTLQDNGKINVAVKSGEELLADTPASLQEANTISALVATSGEGTERGNAIANTLSQLMQGGGKSEAVSFAKEVAPTTSQTVMGVAQGVNNILSNITGTRMAAVGRSGGDTFTEGGMWVQGLMNHTKQDSASNTAGFSADTNGISFGLDGKVNENLMVGFGYGYTNTDADSGARDIDVEGHNFFAYTEYKPNNWYINGMFNYGFSKYDEQKVAGLKGKYDVNTYAANIMIGYDFDNGIIPEVGMRYLLADQESYNDGAQRIKSDKTDVLTGVVGFKYQTNMQATDWTFTPNLRLSATYDMMSDNSKANVSVIGGGNYQITEKRLERFGVETSIGVEATYGDWNLSLDYNGGFRKDFQSHTGMLKAKYNF